MPCPARFPALLLVPLALALGAQASAFTADELIAKHIAARGGRKQLAAITSLRLTGKVSLGRGDSVTEMSYAAITARPGRLRTERTLQGLTTVTAFDGTTGWSVRPFRGRRDPDRLPPDVVKGLQVQADLDGPLVDYQAKGHAVRYLGTEDVDGTPAHKLQVTLQSGDLQYVYLDPDHFLQIRVVSREKRRGVEDESETDYGNYEQVAGVYLPFSIESGDKGEPKGLRVTIEKAEVNLPIDEKVFQFPGSPPAPPAALPALPAPPAAATGPGIPAPVPEVKR